MSADAALGGPKSAIEIDLPPALISRLMRHPALRALGPCRAPWQPTDGAAPGRVRRLSRNDAPFTLSLFQGGPLDGPALLRLRAGHDAPAGAISALGGSLGERLAAAPVLRQEGAPARAPLDGLNDVGPALAAALRDGLTQLMLHAPACRADAPPLGVHQARVALRRMRSVLKLFRPALVGKLPAAAGEEALARFDARLKLLAAALGPARDWDVFVSGLGHALAEALPGDARLRQLHRAAGRARLAAYAVLPPLLAGRAFRSVLWQGAGLVEQLEALPAGGDLREFAQRVLSRRHRRLRRAGQDIEALPPALLHALRLDGKRLRYAAELLAPLWSGQEARRYLRRLARLQEALGLANDATVARALVRSLGSGGWALGVAEGMALGRAAGSRNQSLAAWSKWRKSKRFWKAT